MNNVAKIEIRIDPDCHDPVILIRTDQKTQNVENIIHAIENCVESRYPLIVGYRDNRMELLSQRDIVRVFVESRKVQISTEKGIFESRKSLSYLEQLLNPERFIRISRFEIVNIRKIESFDFSIAGTVRIRFDDATTTWAARRYVRQIQRVLERIETGEEE